MRQEILAAVGLLLLTPFSHTSISYGQITFEGCRDINGVLVASISSSVQDIAMASILNGSPVIYYNPSVLAWVQPQTRRFFYAHECAHHALGHVLSGLRLGQEQQADCWAIKKLREQRLSDTDISTIQSDIAKFGRGDWTHLAGPERAIKLQQCLGTVPPRPGHWETMQCTHALHPSGDLWPCQHGCYWYGRPVPCHPAGDLYPCSHTTHPTGDRIWVPQ